jgi:2'-5' RNA ligase
MKYCIFVTFETDFKKELDEFRSQYDDLAGKVQPHVTVLFPIEIDNDIASIKQKMEKLSQILGFEFEVGKDIVYDGDVGYLEVQNGKDEFVNIYSFLNSGVCQDIIDLFKPHITVVRNSNCKPSEIHFSPDKFLVKELVLECFDHTGYSNELYVVSKNM